MSADLIERIRQRPADGRRWTAWYKLVYPKLYYVAFRFAKGDSEAARDLTQETFARFLSYRALERVTSDRHALSFLITTCRNLAIDRGQRATELSIEELGPLESLAAADAPIEPALDFGRILATLEPQDRELMQMARDGLTVSEIASKLGVTYTAAGVRLHRIRKRLRESHGQGVKI